MQALSPEERIGQLFMAAAYSNKDSAHIKQIDTLILRYKIGGLIFMQGGPVRQARLTNHYQSISTIPLLVAMDAEWGPAMRLDSLIRFPYQMTLGAIKNPKFIYNMGAEVARQLKRLGVHVNFAPVVDINSNPENPVINFRSFGEDKKRVAANGLAYMLGLQDNGILAVAKHFPGHGDTDTDSHLGLPVVNHSIKRLDTLELFPFRELIRKGLSGMMVAHLQIPSLDTAANTAATLSHRITVDLLKDSLKFTGLVFTDALNMKGITQFYEPGVADVKALLAGNDVLLFSENVGKAVLEIKKAIHAGQITQNEIDLRCRKILFAKRYLHLNQKTLVNEQNIISDINTPDVEFLNRVGYENALTVLINKNDFIPVKRPDTVSIASVSIGKKEITSFQEMVGNYCTITHFNLDRNPDRASVNEVIAQIKKYNVLIVSLHLSHHPANNYGLNERIIRAVDTLLSLNDSDYAGSRKIIITVFGNPYTLGQIRRIGNCDVLIEGYEDNNYTRQLSAQLIVGGISSHGKLPVTSGIFRAGAGIETHSPIRLKYSVPEELGIQSSDLDRIDSIALNAIRKNASPGCQVLAAKNGKIFYQKSFGYHTYQNIQPVRNTDLYDLASLTKISATGAVIMKLFDEGKIVLDKPVGSYLAYLRKTNKDTLTIREILAHHAQLRSWIPYWMRTVKNGKLSEKLYSRNPSKKYSIQVADSLFLHKSYPDSILRLIAASPFRVKKEYVYSDLGFYLLKDLIEKTISGKLENYIQREFYSPLGMTTMGYNPMEKFPLSRIIPTENDTAFRKQLIHGYVHDPGAAMLGGVGGHAGVFGTANDLAKLMQMYLQKGEYAGKRYIKPATISEFTSTQYGSEGNRRALGFDKPEPDTAKSSPACRNASPASFGHTGFTGTMAWVDPDEQLVYLFLSNRIHPSAANNLLVEMNVRTEIQQVIYDAIRKANRAKQQ